MRICKRRQKQFLNGLEIICRVDEYLTYAFIHNGDSIVRKISRKNNYEENLESIVLRIECESNDKEA